MKLYLAQKDHHEGEEFVAICTTPQVAVEMVKKFAIARNDNADATYTITEVETDTNDRLTTTAVVNSLGERSQMYDSFCKIENLPLLEF